MSPCAAGTDDRDVRQRSKIVQCKAMSIKKRCKLAIGDTRTDSDGSLLCVQRHLLQVRRQDLCSCGVRKVVERVTRAHSLHGICASQRLP